jgi:hypothetical protein
MMKTPHHTMESLMKTKYAIMPVLAAVLISGCSASGLANAAMQKAASNAITSAQESNRLDNVQRQAAAKANREGDSLLTCGEISSQLADEAVMMATAAEDLGMDTSNGLTNAAIGQAAAASGMASMVPMASMVTGEAARQKELRRSAAETEFYGSKARRDVLMSLSTTAGCS